MSLSLPALAGGPSASFQVLVEERHREIPHVQDRDVCSGGPGSFCGNVHQSNVQRVLTCAARKGDNAWLIAHDNSLLRLCCLGLRTNRRTQLSCRFRERGEHVVVVVDTAESCRRASVNGQRRARHET